MDTNQENKMTMENEAMEENNLENTVENSVESTPQEAPVEAPVETPVETPAEAPAEAPKDKKTLKKEKKANKKAAKKEKKKQKKLARKQLRREVRQRKKDEFRAKGCLGKIFWFFGRLISIVVVIALIATVIQVNYGPIGRFIMGRIAASAMDSDVSSVTQEQIADILPVDEEGAAMIEASAPRADGETWAIYMYIVGSNLESDSKGQMSEATAYYTGISAENEIKAHQEKNRSYMTNFMKEIMDKGMDLPTFFYKKAVPQEIPGWMEKMLHNVLSFEQKPLYAASMDINEMLKVKLPENVKVVFQAGGAGEWSYDKINPNRTQRFVYDANGVQEVYNEQITGMARPETLADFLRYCKDEHPADHTMVLFWNHGGGAFGYGADELFGGDMLSIAEMREAFEDVFVPNEENPPIDLIGFDACLMASLEVANAFNGFAEYLVGSEDVEPGFGWDYTAWLGALAQNPQMNALQLGKAVSDSYINYYCRYGEKHGTPATQVFSMIDLSKVDDLYAAYERLMAKALDDTAENPGVPALLGKCANSAIKYAGEYHNVYNTLDLGMFMDAAMAHYPQEAKAVRDLVDEAVVYNLACGVYAQSQGITVYYPSTITSLDGILKALNYIDDICPSEDIRTLYYYKIAGCLRDDMQAYADKMGYGEIRPMNPAPLKAMTQAQITIGEDQNYTVETDENALELTQSMAYHLIAVGEDGMAKRLGSAAFVDVNDEGNLQTSFEGKWLSIDGEMFPVKMISMTDTMVTCSASVKHNHTNAYLMLGYDVGEKSWNILGVHKKDSDENQILASRTTEELKIGDIIAPVYEMYDMATGKGKEKTGKLITYSEKTKVEATALENGEYMSYICLTDARGDEYNLPVVSFRIEKGEMKDAAVGESRNSTAL